MILKGVQNIFLWGMWQIPLLNQQKVWKVYFIMYHHCQELFYVLLDNTLRAIVLFHPKMDLSVLCGVVLTI